MKAKYNVTLNNFNWLLGDGNSICFWRDAWYGKPLILHLPANISVDDNILVGNLILDQQWSFPDDFITQLPLQCNLANQVIIYLEQKKDQFQVAINVTRMGGGVEL